MFTAILIILILPYVDINKIKSSQFKPFNKFIILSLVTNFIILGILGGCHPTNTVSFVGALATGIYFFIFTGLILSINLIENTLSDVYKKTSVIKSKSS